MLDVLVFAVFVLTFTLDIDTRLSQIKSFLIIVLSILVSSSLYKFAYATFSANASTPYPLRFFLLNCLTILLVLFPMALGIKKYRMKLKKKETITLPDKETRMKDLAFIFLILFLIILTLTELFPFFQNVLFTIFFLLFFVLIVWLI